MAIRVQGLRATIVHDVAAVNARVYGLRATIVHDVDAIDARVQGLRATVVHDIAALDARVYAVRATIVHDLAAGIEGLQGYGAYQSSTDEQLSGVGSQRGWWRFEE